MIISEKHIPSCKFEYTIRYWTGGFLSEPSFEIQEKFLNTVKKMGSRRMGNRSGFYYYRRKINIRNTCKSWNFIKKKS